MAGRQVGQATRFDSATGRWVPLSTPRTPAPGSVRAQTPQGPIRNTGLLTQNGQPQTYFDPQQSAPTTPVRAGTQTAAAPQPNQAVLQQLMGLARANQGPAAPPPVAAPSPQPRISGPVPAGAAGPSVAFSRAKDASGRVGNQALSALRDEFSSRGMGGSTMEAGGVADVIKDTARYQSEAEAGAAEADADRAWEAETLGYQGGIDQRGQDLGLTGSGYSGQITQRGQTIQAQQQQQQAMTALLNAFAGLY